MGAGDEIGGAVAPACAGCVRELRSCKRVAELGLARFGWEPGLYEARLLRGVVAGATRQV